MPLEQVLCIFEMIASDVKTRRALGFNDESSPLDMIICALPVVPPCARNPTMYEAEYETDKLGARYRKIISSNNNIGDKIVEMRTGVKKVTRRGYKSQGMDNLRNKLINEIEALFSHNVDNTKSFKDNPGIVQLLTGKKNLFRSNLEGKRVDYVGRTVAGPDVYLKFGQVGIPKDMAPFLTQFETVTVFNIDSLTELLRSGKVTHVNRGTLADNKIRFPINEFRKKNFQLELGDVIERWLQNGDYVLISRQPILHALSMMGHEVVLHPGLTAKIGLYETSPYNADFDGDELNIHSPVSP